MNGILYKHNCFFCNPDDSRIIASSKNFFAILGLGPIVEGYTIIASKEHYKSTLDLPDNLIEEQLHFKKEIRGMLKEIYGSSIVTEHGRIEACISLDSPGHDDHCFHSHQLIFPINLDLRILLEKNSYKTTQFASIFEAKNKLPIDAEYLYFENEKEEYFFARLYQRCPRQFLRYLVANHLLVPEKSDWNKYQAREIIEEAKQKFESLLSKKNNG